MRDNYPILKSFEEQKGVYDLIDVGIAIVKTYENGIVLEEF